MKIPERTLRTVRAGYLYANGKLVLVHEETHPKTRLKVEWVTIHDTAIRCAFDGRLILGKAGAVRLCLEARAIVARAPSIEGGSENTRKRSQAIGYVKFVLGARDWEDSVHLSIVDGLSSDVELQPETKWSAPDSPYRWGGYSIVDSATGRSVASV